MEIDVKRIAELAYLDISEDKVDDIAEELQNIVNIMSDLPEYNESEFIFGEMCLRDDEELPSDISREELLSNAPKVSNGCFAVPRTVNN
ncbi:Asp-tRNA(Asn)/Glu-tRNA(Gln) amidotransferase subunit GatC [Ruminococcus sp.]|uniref:Asp-tRNA(Asn)/Glu-tRNA(Gln) amidotransferase subunit GatC n=1 Tax=Ruminococcus sp. TaxID=41978 RepID=UPI001B4C15D3|nr:Asp-tRNA(Asn)/Glu-tRNA(Gln) amidotransferase subunit GatC [Ruminococcus sp.]MBP5432808.1 aspartyl/glutamyl-tRNA amidotransferase subunit C [Ruminococcus sp.]